MGYTHYWNAPRDFSRDQWQELCSDIAAIINNVQHVRGVTLANGCGDAGTQPEITKDKIHLNGVGDGSHETFAAWRKRPAKEAWESRKGNDFCKAARKPYDQAVTACLAYLESMHGWRVSSDGYGYEWLLGVETARKALPRYANQIDIPLSVRKGDRWDWRGKRDAKIKLDTERYEIGFCLDGHAYVYDPKDESKCYRFESHDEAATYFARYKEQPTLVRGSREGGRGLFDAWGAFDAKRSKRLARAQNAILKQLIDNAENLGRNKRPPAFARPRVIPKEGEPIPDFRDLFELAP